MQYLANYTNLEVQDMIALLLIASAAWNGYKRGLFGALISGVVSIIPVILLGELLPYLPTDAESLGSLIYGIFTNGDGVQKTLITILSITAVFSVAKTFLLMLIPSETTSVLPGGMVTRIAGIGVGIFMECIVIAKYYQMITRILDKVNIASLSSAWAMLTGTPVIQRIISFIIF